MDNYYLVKMKKLENGHLTYRITQGFRLGGGREETLSMKAFKECSLRMFSDELAVNCSHCM